MLESETPKASHAIKGMCEQLAQKGMDIKTIAEAMEADPGTLKNWLRGAPMAQTERFLELVALCDSKGIAWQNLLRANISTSKTAPSSPQSHPPSVRSAWKPPTYVAPNRPEPKPSGEKSSF